MGQVSIRQIFA